MALTESAFTRAVNALDAVAWRGIKPGLERTRALLDALGNPDQALQGVLVAGTNGKGSVCAIVDSVLRAAGLRTMLLTKPHLISYTERIVLDGRAVSEREFAGLISDVNAAASSLPEDLQPTGFETLTAAGILAAARSRVEVVVCEVGLGGRLDSTNVLDLGTAVITNVALDHTAYLGDTIAAIAREKAAIIKPGDAAVTAAASPALELIRARAAETGATLAVAGGDVPYTGRTRGLDGVEVETRFDGAPISVRTPLVGTMQIANVATAIAACDAMRRRGFAVTARDVTRGCASVRWPGRMQWIPGTPALLVDCAHNPAGMAAMVENARSLIGTRTTAVVFAAMHDKDSAAMTTALEALPAEAVVVTALRAERAENPKVLATRFSRPVTVAANVDDALRIAREAAGGDGVVVVCGSIYLAGEVLEALGKVEPRP
jgi:dihydrofolate synthase/folylpolyglutamate synthase